MKLKISGFIVFFPIVFCIAGCGWFPAEQFSQGFDKSIKNVASISLLSMLYYSKNENWPDSFERLKEFHKSVKNECPDMKLDQFNSSNTRFIQLPDGSLKIEYNSRNGPDSAEEGKFFVSVVLSKPVFEKSEDDNCSARN